VKYPPIAYSWDGIHFACCGCDEPYPEDGRGSHSCAWTDAYALRWFRDRERHGLDGPVIVVLDA